MVVHAASSSAPILVTGATGNVGREVVRVLAARGIPHVIGGRAARPGGSPANAAPVVELDLQRPETFPAAVRGVRALFLVRPPPIADVERTLNVLIDRAAEARVEHVVFLSVIGADRQSWVPHHKVERHLLKGHVAWTLLRSGFFAQNLGDAYRDDVRERDEIDVPAGRGRVAFVDVRDLAELAVNAFEEPSLRNQAWDLTGPEAVSFDEVAQRLTRLLGRTIRYRRASIPGFLLRRRRRGMGWNQALVQTVLHVGIRFGNAAKVDPALEQLLGRRPRTLDDYIRDHLPLWERAA